MVMLYWEEKNSAKNINDLVANVSYNWFSNNIFRRIYNNKWFLEEAKKGQKNNLSKPARIY